MNISSILLTIFTLLIIPSTVSAEDSSVSTLNERRKEVKTEIKVNVNLSALRQEKVRSMFGKMIVRTEATIERLTKLAEKIESRIAKIISEKPDTDLTSATNDVIKAKTLLATTKTEVADLKTKLETLVTSSDPKSVFQEVKTSFESIKTNLKEAHQLLVHSIGDIKGLRKL